MPANTLPIYTIQPDVSTNGTTGMSQPITAAAADYTGVSANNILVHTAGSNGSYVKSLIFKAAGTNVAAVMRIYVNNGSTNTTAANNTLVAEVSLPATTSSTTAPLPDIEIPIEFGINPSFRIYVGLGAAVAAGWFVTTIAGKY